MSSYNPNPAGYAPVGWTCQFCGEWVDQNEIHSHGVITGGYVPMNEQQHNLEAANRAAGEWERKYREATARVAVLEIALLPFKNLADEMRGHDGTHIPCSVRGSDLRWAQEAFKSSPSTPGAAWREMVAVIEESLTSWPMPLTVARLEAALAAAKAVMGATPAPQSPPPRDP